MVRHLLKFEHNISFIESVYLCQAGEMLLSDGRRIVHQEEYTQLSPSEKAETIPLHVDFRMIVLANRPGFPFLGNNFFRECGDCFSWCIHRELFNCYFALSLASF